VAREELARHAARMTERSTDDTTVPEALPGEIAFTLAWEAAGGGLRGLLQGRNVCDHPVRLSNKPVLIPLGITGEPLDTHTAVTLELRLPGYAQLAPGEVASAPVSWGGWDGPPASGAVIVQWDGGHSQAEVAASGPKQPSSARPSTNLSSSWWTLVSSPSNDHGSWAG
jgi:hypothetical protein